MSNYVGNDVVDITSSETLSKYRDHRFIERVFSTEEIKYLEHCSQPDLLLWYLWSAKEAAFKALKKYDRDTVFSHRKFQVLTDDIELLITGANSSAKLKFENYDFSLEWTSTVDWIHCNAIMMEGCLKRFSVFDFKVIRTSDVIDRSHVFSEEENLSIYSEESKAVRVLAKALLYQNGLEQTQIIRLPVGNRFSPPCVYKNSNQLMDWDLSLSHDGAYVACLVTKS